MTNYAPGLTRITATVAGKERFFTRDVQSGLLANPSLFIFFSGGSDSSSKLSKLFGAYLKKYNCLGIYVEAQPAVKGKANFDIKSPPSANNDTAFFNYILAQFPQRPLWISGVSTGGAMALYLACNLGIETICVISAATWKGLSTAYSTADVYFIRGALDTSVPFNSGEAHGVEFDSAFDSAAKMASPFPVKTNITLPNNGKLFEYKSSVKTVKLLVSYNCGHGVLICYKGISVIDSIFLFFKEFGSVVK